MSGWGTPGWLRMKPPVSRWAVAPYPEDQKKMVRQKSSPGMAGGSDSSLGGSSSSSWLARVPVTRPTSSTFLFPQVGPPSTMAFSISSMPRGFSFAPLPTLSLPTRLWDLMSHGRPKPAPASTPDYTTLLSLQVKSQKILFPITLHHIC